VGTYYNATGGHGFLLSKGAFTTIDVPGASLTYVSGINPDGDIVGQYVNATGDHSFLLSKGAFTTIDVPGAYSTGAFAINPEGNIVGLYIKDTRVQGFLLSKGAFTTIDDVMASESTPGVTSWGCTVTPLAPMAVC